MISRSRHSCCLVPVLSLAAFVSGLFGAEPRPVSKDPAAAAPVSHLRGGPASPADLAEIAKLAELPAYTRAAGDGDFRLAPPYAPAPETVVVAQVPKGRVEKFR